MVLRFFNITDNLLTVASIVRRHCELFPSAISVTHELIAELRDILIHRIGGMYKISSFCDLV